MRKFRMHVPDSMIAISEKCVASVLAAIGITAAAQSAHADLASTAQEPNRIATSNVQAPIDMGEGAIYLSLVSTDPITGEQIARHYSHASHSSHASHHSHYSGR